MSDKLSRLLSMFLVLVLLASVLPLPAPSGLPENAWN